MYIYFILIAIFFYYLHLFFNNHFWYNFNRKSKSKNFYVGYLNHKIQSKSLLTPQETVALINLYKNYFPNITVNFFKINNFLKTMPNPVVIYLPEGNNIVASVFNSIVPIIYNNKKLKSNFVDYAVVKRIERNKGIFVDLMHMVSHISNKNDVDIIIFKIDIRPIPSYMGGYLFKSSYYYIKKEYIKLKSANARLYEYKGNEIQYLKKFMLWAPLEKHILTNNEERITLEWKGTIVNIKINNLNNFELMYILNPNLDNLENILGYLCDNYSFTNFVLDDIGDNDLVLKILEMRYNYDVYHYLLGFNGYLHKKDFYYYF